MKIRKVERTVYGSCNDCHDRSTKYVWSIMFNRIEVRFCENCLTDLKRELSLLLDNEDIDLQKKFKNEIAKIIHQKNILVRLRGDNASEHVLWKYWAGKIGGILQATKIAFNSSEHLSLVKYLEKLERKFKLCV